MATVLKSLEDVSKGYKVFEKDQVLTEEQLNRLADYLDDQERLTRVALLGVGIACGLRPVLSDSKVILTKGVGVTTDGDLLRVPADLTYTRFRAYDQTAPVYAPFYDGANMRKVFELVSDDVATAATLDGFQAASQKKLADMTAVLLMESYVKDGDLCTGGDCDNKGQDAISNVKLLLLDRKDIDVLRESLPTPDSAARQLDTVVADRAQLTETITSVAALAQAYRTAAANTRDRLKVSLAKVFPACSAFLGDVFPADPAPRWNQVLGAPVADAGIQHYYDFIKDLVETCNAFRDALFGDTSVCCPPLGAFPKHLVLGSVGGGGLTADPSRTGLYPSPLAGGYSRKLEHARFLARKIDALITSFKIPVDLGGKIAVTPSLSEDRSLEERAIPAYYAVNKAAAWPIHRAWSYQLERRDMAQFNYSARAGEYDGAGASLSPLTAQIGAFSFFRIEGHLGREASAAVSEIEATIKTSNLPFLVRSVLLGGDRPKIVVKPPIRYTDLNRLHYILRQDLSQQLDDVVTHNTTFRTEVNAAIDRKDVVDAPVTGGFPSIKAFADAKQTGISDAAGKAKAKLNVGYAEYRKAATWQGDVKQTVTHAAELKYYLGGVARTEFATPVDSLVSNNHVLWVDWLDRVIQDKDDKEDDKLLFANFIQQHPSAEHFGGVGRGGTFVLVYNSAGIVIGDVALPYRWAETAEPPPAEPPLPRPDVKPPIVIDKGVRIVPALDNVIASRIDVRLADFKTTAVDPIRDQGINFQKNYVQALKDSVAVTGKFSPTTSVPLPGVKDSTLDTKVRETQDMVFKVDEIQKQLIDPALDATKRTDLENQLTAARKDLATSVTDTAKYVSTTPTLDARTDSAVAITVISDAMSKLSHDQATSVATTVKTDLAGAVAAKPEVKTMIGGMLKVRGFTN